MTPAGLPLGRLSRWIAAALTVGLSIGFFGPEDVAAVAHAASVDLAAVPWFVSRMLGFVAYLALATSVLYGLLLSTKLLERLVKRPVSFTLHRDLAAAAVSMSIGHGLLLMLDRTISFSLIQLAVPFTTAYRPFWVGLGQVALFVAIAILVAFALRRRVGQRSWRALHGLAFAAFVAATAHGIAAGTDSRSWWAWWMYGGATAISVFLLTYRLALAGLTRATPSVRADSRAA
jgi:sulfoxide reductase heme-binding subunit YedZ